MLTIPVYNTMLLPEVQYHLGLSTLTEVEIEKLENEEHIILLPQKEGTGRSNVTADDFYKIGVVAEVKGISRDENGITLTVLTKERVDVIRLAVSDSLIHAEVKIRTLTYDIKEEEEKDLLEEMKKLLLEASAGFQWGPWIAQLVKRWSSSAEIISMIAPYLDMDAETKYEILKIDSIRERENMIRDIILQLRESLTLQVDVSKKMKESQEQAYREAAIHKQMEVLQKELDDLNPDAVSEEQAFLEKIKQSGMPKEAEKEVMRVYNRFKQEGKNGHEYGSLYDYLDFVTSLSWKTQPEGDIDLERARQILDMEHYGLDKIKKRILEQIAVMALRKQQSGSIILFVGAPGTGKTSMGKSIAEALDREYVRISLGGVRDEAEIRGHRRTYVGAMPGRIMEGMKRSGVMNPVMVLDEIDKLSVSYNGDPASALLEVLDPEQNNTFTDHYMNVPYDLSNVMFVCTANTLDSIPRPLLDRMEVIQLSGYTPVEKFHIAKGHLLKKSLEDAGIKKSSIAISDTVLKKIIEDYTMEAGVRGLKKQLDHLCRQTAVKLVAENRKKVTIKEKELKDLLGRKLSDHDKKLKKETPGVVTGLAWTAAGGDILFIETTAMHGNGRIHVTGQLGDVMKESADIAVSLLKSIFYHENLNLSDKDIHIHVPSGAVPKDGPSAGITLFTALTSLVTGIAPARDLAMTGEISLRGQVLPIGGLPEKLMAAERAGIKKVLIPAANQEDLKEVSEEIKEKLEIQPVDTIEEVIQHALNIRLPKNKKSFFMEADNKIKFVIPTVKSRSMEPATL